MRLNKSELEKLSEKYFNNIKIKEFLYFNEETPKGNKISGYINRKPNRYLGSMIITSVNDNPTEQFIQSMPKIHYFKEPKDISAEMGMVNFCYEKLDGSCLIIYPLKNEKGDIIEIIPKTRGRPVADTHFMELFNKINQKSIIDYYKENEGILIFELYGILNQHDILHYDVGIDAKLISIYETDFINNKSYIESFGFQLPDTIFELYKQNDGWYIEFVSKKYKNYLNKQSYQYPFIEDAISGMKELLEKINKTYQEYNNRLAIEGVVINTITDKGFKKFLKCKPTSIEIKHKSESGIPKMSIRKEVYKYFDEYDVDEMYKKDPKHHTEYIYRMLNEEYPIEYIYRSKNKIEKIFMEIWDSKQVPISIHEISQELYDKYGGEEDIGFCMRKFAEIYPTKKKDSHMVYNVLSKYYKNKIV